MKKIFILILLVSTVSLLNAQETEEQNEPQSIFNSKPEKIRGYAGPLYNTTYLDGEIAYMTGFNAAGIFNNHYILGIYSLNLENNIFSNNNNYIGYEMNFDHRGLWLGYIFMPKRIVHFNVNAQIGKGNLEIYDEIIDSWIEDDFIFVLSPSIEAEFNVAKFFKLGIGANYRFALDVDKFDNYNDSDFTDFGAFISFKFGWFN